MYIKSSIWSGFEIKNRIEDQFQSSPKLVGISTVLNCIFVPNLKLVTPIGGELWHEQGQNWVNFDFGVQFDVEGHNQSSHKTIGILTKVLYISGSNLVILAWTGGDLSHGQAGGWCTHGRTHRQTQAATIPEGQNWPRVKIASILMLNLETNTAHTIILRLTSMFIVKHLLIKLVHHTTQACGIIKIYE